VRLEPVHGRTVILVGTWSKAGKVPGRAPNRPLGYRAGMPGVSVGQLLAPPSRPAEGAAGYVSTMKLLDPVLNDLTPKHIELYWHYQVVRTAVDFGAVACFVVGSAFFFFASTTRAADWLFLVGSLFFALKPTIDMVRSAHLRRLPGQDNSRL
jgi:hypothetical protein